MTREERNELLADLRAAGVSEYVADGALVRVVFFPSRPTLASAEDKPAPRPQRSEDEKLFGPLRLDRQAGT